MPLISDDPGELAPRVLVGASVAVELDWALGAAFQPGAQREHSQLEGIYAAHPALAERLRSFWGPEESTTWCSSIELQLLADNAGILLSDEPATLLDNLDDVCAHGPLDLRLASEPPADRAALLARLGKLRRSPAVRRRYVALVRDLWSALAPLWEPEGRAAVGRAVSWRSKLAEKGRPWREVAGSEDCRCERLEDLERSLGPGGTVVVVPAYFASGRSFVDLPGAILIGVHAEGAAEGSRARAKLEPLARQLKALSDPTRLAMLEALATAPATVGELAQRFAVAQPTASNHVKLLREAGLVRAGTGAERRKLTAEPALVAEVANELGSITAGRSQPQGGL